MLNDFQREIQEEVRRRRTVSVIADTNGGRAALLESLRLSGEWTVGPLAVDQQDISLGCRIKYMDLVFNFLSPPAEQDFSEDSYRTLTAAENTVVLLDPLEGCGIHVRRLLGVWKLLSRTTFVFVDHVEISTKHPLEMLGEIERELGLLTYPLNWPICSDNNLLGLIERSANQLVFPNKSAAPEGTQTFTAVNLDGLELMNTLDPATYEKVRKARNVLSRIGSSFSPDMLNSGRLALVVFGSSRNGLGVKTLLRSLLDHSHASASTRSSRGEILPTYPELSAIVFSKNTPAGLQPAERFAVARVLSGVLVKGMEVRNSRTGRPIYLSDQQLHLNADPDQEFYPGDIVAISNVESLRRGDTLHTGPRLAYPEMPSFPPEHLVRIRSKHSKDKWNLCNALKTFAYEGDIVLLNPIDTPEGQPVLAAVGRCELAGIQSRLQAEHGIETSLTDLCFAAVRWVANLPVAVDRLERVGEYILTYDHREHPVVLFYSSKSLKIFQDDFPDVGLSRFGPSRLADDGAPEDVSGRVDSPA